MQLILDAESTVELKTKMSLSEDNLEKSVSDILSDVKNDSICNGDVTNGNKDATELKENTDVDKIGQLKEAVLINTVAVDNGTTISKNSEIDSNAVGIQTPHDCESTGFLNGYKEIITNSVPIDQSQDLPENIEKEYTTVEKNFTNSEPIDQSHCIIESFEEKNTTVEKKIANSEPIDESHNIINSVKKESTIVAKKITNSEPIDESRNIIDSVEKDSTIVSKNITNSEPINQSHNVIDDIEKENSSEKNNSNKESCIVETVLKHGGLSENNASEQLSESESVVTEHITVCNNFESELTTLQSSDKDSVEPEVVHDNGVSPCIESNVHSSEHVNIKQGNDKTEVGDDKQTNFSDNCDSVKKEVEESRDDNHIGADSSLAIKEHHDDIAKNLETCTENATQIVMMNPEIEKNVPAIEAKETLEADSTEGTSNENIDVKSDICDVPQDSCVRESHKEKPRTNDLVEKESLNVDNVTKMDVDESANKSNEQEIKEPTKSTTKLTQSKDCEIIESETVSTLDKSNSSDDGIFNLDDDNEKFTLNMETSEPTHIIVDDDKPIINCDDDTNLVKDVEKSVTVSSKSIDEIIDLDENVPKEKSDSKSSSEADKKKQDNIKGSLELKPMEPVLKLSNTLNILSDDEDELEKTSHNDSKCINIEDDDDVMLIDDDATTNENKLELATERDVGKESKPASPRESFEIPENSETPDKIDKNPEKDTTVSEKEVRELTPTPHISEQVEENKLQIETQKSLIPENFLKTCKKNLVDMTREELEEFCILKIVESILDRSNLSEIKNKLKVLTQNIDDYKKKALMLSKQNRDLQVVLKSIQDDVKKNNEAPIVPLKITRSVGMQVLMADKPEKRRRTGIGMPNTNKQLRTPVMQNPRPQKPPTQQIPVPRLVPANNTAIKSPNAQQVNTPKVTSPLPNGIKTVSPAQKGEKRPYNRIQSVTVDLTDDEPQSKVVNRTQNPVPPVRLVPSQNLLAAPRTPAANSPRKVYIPISGPQAQNVRPGQTIMLKTVPSSSPRQRVPPHMVRMPQSLRMTRPQGLRHPAPLPECMKQYQPPNWKALPPAPDLKLAKVENGIVISWKIEGYQEDSYEEIASYQLYAYQETTSPPNTSLWKKIGDVKALPLPMACTLTQFMAGYKYYFAVRAVDIRSRLGPFSMPGSILLLSKM